MAIGKFLAPLNGRINLQQEKPYVDDIFDPLFNREVTSYYRGLYGPIGAIPAGYAAMLDNALTGRQGILGPGMGILSTFGRSMDKADDFILGGLTEGVNLIGQGLRGNNETPKNPFERIFVDDYDYQGTKLMAAMGNAMARFTGTQTPLDESDFQSLGDKVAGTTLDLATDPGIMGGQLARLNPNTPVGQVGQILSNYDDTMANVAGNMAFPGGKAMIGKGLNKIKDFVAGASSTAPVDMVIKHNLTEITDPFTGVKSYSSLSPDTLYTLRKMSDDYSKDLDPMDDADLYAIKEEIDELTNVAPKTPENLTDLDMVPPSRLAKKDEAVQRIKDTASKHREEILHTNDEGMKVHSEDFLRGMRKSTDVNPIVTFVDSETGKEVSKRLRDLDEDELLNYVRDNFKELKQVDYNGNPYEFGQFYNDVSYYLDRYGLNEAKDFIVSKKLTPEYYSAPRTFVFAPNRKGFQTKFAKDALDVIDYHFTDFLRKHPDGLNKTYLKKALGMSEKDWLPNNVFYTLSKFSDGRLPLEKGFKNTPINKFDSLLNILYKRDIKPDDIEDFVTETVDSSHSFIPWVKNNRLILSKTQLGRDLIDLADNLERDVFDNILYETATKNSSVQTVASFNEKISKEFSDVDDVIPTKNSYTGVIDPAKRLNQYFSKDSFTPEDYKAYAEDFPYMDLKVSQDYIKDSPEYAAYQAKIAGIDNRIKKEQTLRSEIIATRNKLKTLTDKSSIDYYENTLKNLTAQYNDINPRNLKPEDWRALQEKVRDAIVREPTDLERDLEKYYIPAKQNYWKLTRGNKYAYDKISLTPHNLYAASKKAMIATDMKVPVQKFSKALATYTPEEFTRFVTSNLSYQDNVAEDLITKTFKDFKTSWSLPDNMDPITLEDYVRKFGDNSEKTLFGMISSAMQSKVKNKIKTVSGAMNVPSVKKSKETFDTLKETFSGKEKQLEEYFSRVDMAEGATLPKNLLESLEMSSGIKTFIVPKEYTQAQIDALSKQIQDNISKVNANGKILNYKTIDYEGNKVLAVFWDTDNINIKKDIRKIYGLFGKKDLDLKDVVLRNPTITKTAWDSSALDKGFEELTNAYAELTKTMGYENVSKSHIMHVLEDSEESRKYFGGLYEALGTSESKLSLICDALKNEDIASKKLIFGQFPVERSHLGYFGQYTYKGKNLFSTDLSNIHSATFTKGMMDNTNVQTFFDLFLTDNFKIQNNFDNVDTLKQALNLSDGNLNNLSLVAPKYNAKGRLVGFTRYDKLSDAGLARAFKDPNAVLLPDAVIGSLDRMCKKDIRMSNRIYRFINKYLTVPFKFGTLANPGFLAGNIQDAYFKQAVELSKKYGASVGEELTNVAMSMRQVITLNNNFSVIFENYREWLKNTDLSILTRSDKPANWYADTFRKSQSIADTLTIDQVINNHELYKSFKEYLAYHMDPKDQKLAKFYLYLNNNQTSTMFKNNYRDMEDLTDLITNNPYAAPNNIVERVMYGNPTTKGFTSYGLFLNNPVSNQILKSSTAIENLMRSATIINDLQHQGYSFDDMCKIVNLDATTEKALRAKFNMSVNEAINTMNAVNFDYDNVSELMNKASYILPFPTFYLKNLAFWADIFTNKPQYIDNIISVHEGLWSGKNTNDEFVAEAKGRGAVPIGQQKGLKHLTGIVKQTPYNSMFGAFNAVNNVKEDFTYRTNPVLRPITRHLQDPNDIKYRPYNTNQYQKNITQKDPQFSELAYMFHQLNPYDRFINTYARTPGKVAKNDYQISDFLPSMFQPDFSKK